MLSYSCCCFLIIRCHAVLAHIKSWKTNPMPSWCLSIFYWLLRSDSLFHGSTRYFIQYNSVWFDWAAAPSLLTLWARPRLLQPHCVVVPLRWHLDDCLSPSPSSCCLFVFVPLFSLSALSPRPHGSPRLLTALSPPFSHTLIVHLAASLWCLSECQAGRPWSDLAG